MIRVHHGDDMTRRFSDYTAEKFEIDDHDVLRVYHNAAIVAVYAGGRWTHVEETSAVQA